MTKKNETLSCMTTMRIGGKPLGFLYPQSYEELRHFISLKQPYYILGGGSNVLATDNEIKAHIIKLDQCPKILNVVKESKTKVWIQASANISKFQFLSFCRDQ